MKRYSINVNDNKVQCLDNEDLTNNLWGYRRSHKNSSSSKANSSVTRMLIDLHKPESSSDNSKFEISNKGNQNNGVGLDLRW